MSIIGLIVLLAVLGLVVWAVTTYIPMQAGIKKVIQVTGVVIAILVVLSAFGILGNFHLGNVPRVN